MNFSDAERLELAVLCDGLVDGRLNAEGRERLERLLKSSAEARRVYVQTLALSASLHEYAAEMQAGDGTVLALPAQPRLRWRRWVAGVGLAAGVALAFWWAQRPMEEAASGAPVVATLSATSGQCRWEGRGMQCGEGLHGGQMLDLAGGSAEVTFDSGAQLLIEGPARLEIFSAWEAALHKGTLSARVPEEARGFRMLGPEVEVVDKGTEFTLEAEGNGRAELVVLKGSVTTRSSRGADSSPMGMLLGEKQARRFSASGSEDVQMRDRKVGKFNKKERMERSVGMARIAHWSFDEAASGGGAGDILGTAAGDWGGVHAELSGVGSRSEGRWAGGLRMEDGAGIDLRLPGVSMLPEMSLAFWMRADAARVSKGGRGMVSATLGSRGRFPFFIGWNRHPGDGVIGALRTDFGRGRMVGVSPLCDGAWHHVAVVFARNLRSEARMEAKQYVDGKLEVVTSRRVPMREWGARTGLAMDVIQAGFEGDLDELFVVDRAFSPAEIRHLRDHNRPLVEASIALQ